MRIIKTQIPKRNYKHTRELKPDEERHVELALELMIASGNYRVSANIFNF